MIAAVVVLALVASIQASPLTPLQESFVDMVQEQMDAVRKHVSSAESLVQKLDLKKFRADMVSSLESGVSKMVEESAARVTKQADELRKQGKNVNVKACLGQYNRMAAFRRGDLRRAGLRLVNYAVDDLQIIATQAPKLIAQAESYLEAAKQEAPNVTEDNTKKAYSILKDISYSAQNAEGVHGRVVEWTKQVSQVAQNSDKSLEDGGFAKLEREAVACMRP